MVQAAEKLPPQQSDYLSWGRLAADAIAELSLTGKPVAITIIGDAVQVDERVNLNWPITVSEAERLASTVRMPNLASAHVAMVGVGIVDGPPAPAGGEYVSALRAFAHATCTTTGAACLVTTTSVYTES
jgi:hypothetical protein